MIENFDVFDFTLSSEDKERIDLLNENQSLFFNHQDPSIVERFASRVK